MAQKILLAAMLALAGGGCVHNVPLGGKSPEQSAVRVVDGPMPEPQIAITASGVPAYPLGPNDRLSVQVANLAGLEQAVEIAVSANGTISIPIAGTIQVAGRTPAQAEELARQAMRRAYIRDPKVTINLLEIRSKQITVDGKVREAGLYRADQNMSLMRSIAAAKGLSDDAKLEDVVLFRTVNGTQYAALYNLAAIRRGIYADPRVYADDVIIVGDSPGRRLFRDLVQVVPTLGYLVVSVVK